MDKDFLEELIEERTALNPDFPKIFDEAWQERLAQQEELPRRSGSMSSRPTRRASVSETGDACLRAVKPRKRQAQP